MMQQRVKLFLVAVVFAACTAEETDVEPGDFKFDGTCVNCHAGLSAQHVHANYKLRCIDCHGGNDQVQVPADAFKRVADFRNPATLKQAHVLPDKNIARFFYANGVDDDGDGNCRNDRTIRCVKDEDCGGVSNQGTIECQLVDEPPVFNVVAGVKTDLIDPGEILEPGLHGEGIGEFFDSELNRDLNYTRFLNPGDLRVAAIGCGGGSRAAFDGGGNGACHQQTIDIVRRSIMVNQAAVTNGAYYGNESWRAAFIAARDNNGGAAKDPRFGAFSYGLDYAEDKSVDSCVRPPANPIDPRSQPFFDKACLKARAEMIDGAAAVSAGGNSIRGGVSVGNRGVTVNGHVENPSTFEIAQGTIPPVKGLGKNQTLEQIGAGDTRFPWGGKPSTSDAHADLEPLQTDFIPGLEPGTLGALNPDGIPDPVDNILRTFRAYYPLNYPGSTTNFNFTFGTSILPEIALFKTSSPYGRGHSSGCAACHAGYEYDGARRPTKVRKKDPVDTNGDGVFQDNELFDLVVDPTTKHREFDPKKDRGPLLNDGNDRLVGRPVKADEVVAAGAVAQGAVDIDNDGVADGEQQKTYSANHFLTAKVTTKTCGLCHGFVTRINYAYQGMAEEEQRDSMARRAPIEFTTPKGTKVRISDSWVREENKLPVFPEGVNVVKRARERNAKLAEQGFLPGFGGCAPEVFTEDCNNNGELDTNLTLQKTDAFGKVIAQITINEDDNKDGTLDLIDRLPREDAIDGRQVRYVYGGRNGSTRQMDIHFQRGMECIDCHFIQDVHGDGNVYSTNWDAIEIECEDCHGATQRTNFLTSGPNGGNDLRLPRNEDLEPFFEEVDGAVIQRSRVTRGLAWVVPQTVDFNNNPTAKEAHNPETHIAAPGAGSTFEGQPGQSKIVQAKLECQTCHNGFVTNCLGCHVDINVGDKQRDFVDQNGVITKSAGENEIWLSNQHNPGHINFQLLGLLRGPVLLGVGSLSEKGRLETMRSSMQAHASVSDASQDTLRENLTFTTFQPRDGNTGHINAATSGVAVNQTMGHTVRPNEARGCETCHELVGQQGEVLNDHLLAQTYGLGTGSLPFTGDWIFAAGTNGLELFEYKQEKELANNFNAAASQRFPGLIVNFATKTLANVEPAFGAGTTGVDVALIRNFNPEPALGSTTPPSLRDFAAIAIDQGGVGRLVLSDVSARGHRVAATRPNGNVAGALIDIVNLSGVPTSVAHMGSDVSDPYIYVAVGAAGVDVIKFDDAPLLAGNPTATRVATINTAGIANKVVQLGDLLYVGSTDGTIEAFDITDPENAQSTGSSNVLNQQINDIAVAGFVMYVCTPAGLAALSLFDVNNPQPVEGTANVDFVGPPCVGVYPSAGHVFVAAGAQGVHEIDARTPAAMVDLGELAAGQNVNAIDVIVSVVPGQKWVVALEATGQVAYIKLDNTLTRQERCYPDLTTCKLELEMFDPTQSGRDPSFDPLSNTFDAGDPSGVTFARQAPAILAASASGRLARPTLFEQVGTLSGRRYRDSFMPGSSSLSTEVMQAMRAVAVCELPGQESTNPSGLDLLGYFDGTSCVKLQDFRGKRERRKQITKPPVVPKPEVACSQVTEPIMHKILCGEPAQPAQSLQPVEIGSTAWVGSSPR